MTQFAFVLAGAGFPRPLGCCLKWQQTTQLLKKHLLKHQLHWAMICGR